MNTLQSVVYRIVCHLNQNSCTQDDTQFDADCLSLKGITLPCLCRSVSIVDFFMFLSQSRVFCAHKRAFVCRHTNLDFCAICNYLCRVSRHVLWYMIIAKMFSIKASEVIGSPLLENSSKAEAVGYVRFQLRSCF